MTLPLASGDLTLRQLEAAFSAIRRVRDLALEGFSEGEIALELDWRREDVREAARIQGFTLSPLVTHQSVCPVCGALTEPDKHCSVCLLRRRLERLHEVNVEEHEREVARLENEIDAIKQSTKRCRERMGTNPRMKTHSGWIAWLAENPSKLEEVVLAVQEALSS